MQNSLGVNVFRCLLILGPLAGVRVNGQEAAGMEAGWKADLKRMGFEVPVEELAKVS